MNVIVGLGDVPLHSQGTVEEKMVIRLEAGKSVDVRVEYTNTKPPEGPESDRSQPALMRGVVGISLAIVLKT